MVEKPELKKKYRLIVHAALGLLLLALLTPYNPPDPDIVTDPKGIAFSPIFGNFLQYVFETGPEPLKDILDQADVHYSLAFRQADIILVGRDGAERRLNIHKKSGEGVDLGYARLTFIDEFTDREKKSIATRLLKPSDQVADWMPKTESSERLFGGHRFSDIYAHLVMLLLAFTLYLIFSEGFRARFGGEDRALVLPLLMGLFSFFVLAEPSIGDIKLHFFNEARQVYTWDLYGPGNAAFQKLLYRLLPMSDRTLFFMNRVFGILCALPIYVIMRDRFGGRNAGVWTAFLLLAHPIWLRYSASDIAHPWALFLFFSAVMLLGGEKRPKRSSIVLAFSALTLAMLGRGEFMALALAAPLMIGFRRIREIVKGDTRSVVYCLLFMAIVLLPNVISLAAFIKTDPDELVQTGHLEALKTWFWLGGGNTFADLRWSPWPQMLLTALGFILLLRHKTLAGLALFAIPPLFLWNPYILQPVFSSTHYQLSVYPIYIMAGGFGASKLMKYLLGGLQGSKGALAQISVGAAIWAVGILGYPELVKGNFTFMEQYRRIAANRHLVNPDCAIAFVTPMGDTDLFNPGNAWFADEFPPTAEIGIFAKQSPEELECLVYLRTPVCSVYEEIEDPPVYNHIEICRKLEAEMEWEALWEGTVPAREACGELYTSDPIPVGFYQVSSFGDWSIGKKSAR